MTPPDHQCDFRSDLEQTRAELAALRDAFAQVQAELEQVKRRSKQHKSEKMLPPGDALRRESGEKASPAQTLVKRKERGEARLAIEWRDVTTPVPAEARCCPRCSDAPELTPLPPSDDKISLFVEYEPGVFVGERRRLETLACITCDYITTAPAPDRVGVARRHGPGFIAYLITAKCADSIPLYRLEKRFGREGIPMARQTMNDLLHGAAEELRPIANRILELIREQPIVRADETSMRVQKREKRGYFWTFLTELFDSSGDLGDPWLVAYQFSPDRSGETPAKILGGSRGTLVIDGFTGYNRILHVEGRRRSGCLAHARRKFHDAIETSPTSAQEALNLILDIYRVEHEAREQNIVGTDAHLELRKTKGRAAMDKLAAWLKEQAPLHPPRGPLGIAIRYAQRQWSALSVFLEDARIPIDNNASERALRVIALGRKNYLHVGHDEAGRNLAVLYTLVATCEANGVNPQEYLKDVLIRIKSTAQSRLDELLPHRWAAARRSEPNAAPPNDRPPSAPISPNVEGLPTPAQASETARATRTTSPTIESKPHIPPSAATQPTKSVASPRPRATRTPDGPRKAPPSAVTGSPGRREPMTSVGEPAQSRGPTTTPSNSHRRAIHQVREQAPSEAQIRNSSADHEAVRDPPHPKPSATRAPRPRPRPPPNGRE